jgi:hypothetical protein
MCLTGKPHFLMFRVEALSALGSGALFVTPVATAREVRSQAVFG